MASGSVPEALLRHRALIESALRAEVDRLPAACVPAVAYHFGWRDADGRELHGHGGKAIRPAMTLLAAEAVGAAPETALPGAVAVELVHTFSLIHDDIMDGDAERRHQQTVWAQWGVAHAVIVGDALLAHAQRLLLEDECSGGPAAAAELARATALMIEGQVEDMSLAETGVAVLDRTVTMEAHKTGALFACACALGALLGGAGETQVAALRVFGLDLGLCFQAVDDVLGIWGDPARTGKPAASDLREGKMSLPIVHALGSPESDRLSEALAGDRDDKAFAAAVAALDAAGSREWCAAFARDHLERAVEVLEGGGLQPGPAEDLTAIARFLVERGF
jgi:geranylgeranyl diphosphate synthase type I